MGAGESPPAGAAKRPEVRFRARRASSAASRGWRLRAATGAPGLLAAPGGQHEDIAATLELSLAPTTAAPGRARTALDDWLAPGVLDSPTDDDARLLVTELVSNAVRHAQLEDGEPLRLRAWLRKARLHIELWDAGADGTIAAVPPRLSDEGRTGGFGLNLVASLSADWGVHRDARGTTVWLELPTAPGTAA